MTGGGGERGERERLAAESATAAEGEPGAQPIAPAVPDVTSGAGPAASPPVAAAAAADAARAEGEGAVGAADAAAAKPRPRGGGSAGHAVKVAAGIFLSRIAGFLREALAARYFAVGVHGDIYSTAMRLPNLLQNLLGDQALSASFIPFYSKMLGQKREEDASRFAGAILGLLILVAGLLAVCGVVFAGPVVALSAPGYIGDAARVAHGQLPVDRFALTVTQVRVLFPMSGFLVLSAWALAVLNSHRRFFLPYFAPVLWNAAIIASLLLAAGHAGGGHLTVEARSRILYISAWGALAGGVLQLAVQLPTVMKLLHGFHLSFSTRVPGVRDALRAFGPVVAGRGAMQLSGFLDFFLASLAAVGAQSALRYALTLFLLPVSLFATSVAATELPEMSRLSGDEARIRRLQVAWRQISFLSMPSTVGFLAFGWLVVGLVFRRGAFGAPDQALVSWVLLSFTVGLLPATTSRLLQNLFYSLHETRYPARIAMLRVAISVVAGGALMFWLDRYAVIGAGGAKGLRMGAAGLGFGASVGAWVELVMLARAARRRIPGLTLPWGATLRMVALAAGSAALAGALWWLLAGHNLYLVALVVLGGFALAYLAGAVLLRFPEMQAWIGRLR